MTSQDVGSIVLMKFRTTQYLQIWRLGRKRDEY